MKVCHISDTHGAKNHTRLIIPECDLLIHSGDIGGRTTLLELEEFLRWFSRQPAKYKVWTAGNHDLCMDPAWAHRDTGDAINMQIRRQIYSDSLELLKKYPEITYLDDSEITISGFKIWGSAITPSFHRQHWAFNRDRGDEIAKTWGKIPNDVNILITHGPPYGILDIIPEEFKSHPGEDVHRGCSDLGSVIKKRLLKLELHCFGHIHDGPTGILVHPVSNSRYVTFSNGSVLSNNYTLVVTNPPIINL